jgi:hypothetical protein
MGEAGQLDYTAEPTGAAGQARWDRSPGYSCQQEGRAWPAVRTSRPVQKLKFWNKTNKGADLKKRAEELEKDEEIQNKLEEKDREWEQVLSIHRGQKCEPEHLTAASDGEMDAKQQTVQVHVEDFKLSENSLIQRNEEEIFESTLQQVKKLKEGPGHKRN